MNGRQCLALALLGSLAACSRPSGQTSEPAASGPVPTQTLQDFKMQDMRDGVRSMNLEAAEGRLYEESQVADLEQPYVVFYQKGKVSSHMRAPRGRIFMQTHAVEAWGGVTLVTTDSTTLTTERLQYDPKTRLITSTDTVHVEKADSITDGQGLRTDPELKHVRIGKQRVRLKGRGAS